MYSNDFANSNIIYGLSLLLPSTFVETIPRLFGENFQIVPEEKFWQNSFVPGMFHDEIQLFYSNSAPPERFQLFFVNPVS